MQAALELFLQKHCAIAAYLNQTDWMFVLDADTAVVNPNHCIEEWIDPNVNIILYERFFNWEIASGNYIVKNTQFTYDFLKRWANWELSGASFQGYDNGVLQLIVLQTVKPEATNEIDTCKKSYSDAKDYETYIMNYVLCVKAALGNTRLWPGRVRIFPRAHGWVRDWFLTDDKWCELDFMFHGYKHNNISTKGWESPFERAFNVSECGAGLAGWHWRQKKRIDEKTIKSILDRSEKETKNKYFKDGHFPPWVAFSDIGDCWQRFVV